MFNHHLLNIGYRGGEFLWSIFLKTLIARKLKQIFLEITPHFFTQVKIIKKGIE